MFKKAIFKKPSDFITVPAMALLIGVVHILTSTLFSVTWRLGFCAAIIFGTTQSPPYADWLKVMAGLNGLALAAAMPFALRAFLPGRKVGGRRSYMEPFWVSVVIDATMLTIAAVLSFGNPFGASHWFLIPLCGFISAATIANLYSNIAFYLCVKREGAQAVARSMVQEVLDSHFRDEEEEIYEELAKVQAKLRERSPFHWNFVEDTLYDEVVRARQMMRMGVI